MTRRFNLLDDPWIKVTEKDGMKNIVSMTDIFRNAADYIDLSGETGTQNFAVLRVILAAVQTVFSRYDFHGNPIVSVDGMMRQTEKINDEDELDDYENSLNKTWKEIFCSGSFPPVIFDYLKKWHDHFYLYDDKYPFFQITEKTMKDILPKGKKATAMKGRFLNKKISETASKTALFIPTRYEDESKKDVMKDDELIRWLILFQGYPGTFDKTKPEFMKKIEKATGEKQTASKGWLYDIGGIYIKGNNLFETLMYNYIPVLQEERYRGKIQRPCWEYSDKEIIRILSRAYMPDNLAELYTNWSRAIYIDSNHDESEPVLLNLIKVYPIIHCDVFIEPMTLWKFNNDGDMKGHFTPRLHSPEKAMWRNFGIIALPSSNGGEERTRQPEIIARADSIIGNQEKEITIEAVSMISDGRATSWLPADEVDDCLELKGSVLGDYSWVIRISDTVNETEKAMNIYGSFVNSVLDINRNGRDKSVKNNLMQQAYSELNIPFKKWLRSINISDSKDMKTSEWKNTLKKLLIQKASEFVDNASFREMKGISKGGSNIITAYNGFRRKLYFLEDMNG